MKPVVKAYKNDSELEVDVTALQDKGIGNQDIYVLSLDKSRTEKIVEDTNILGIDIKKENGSEREALKRKLIDLGVEESEVATCKSDMDDGIAYLIVTDVRVTGLWYICLDGQHRFIILSKQNAYVVHVLNDLNIELNEDKVDGLIVLK